jgi:hypothetical protein
MSKVVSINSDGITFDDGIVLSSDHDQDCCESHSLTFSDLTLTDFEGLDFNLKGDDFFKRIPDFGIEPVPEQGFPIRIPGHGYNNGYYGSNIDLCIAGPGWSKKYDITECQKIAD